MWKCQRPHEIFGSYTGSRKPEINLQEKTSQRQDWIALFVDVTAQCQLKRCRRTYSISMASF